MPLLNQLMSNGGVCRTAPATPGLLNTKLNMIAIVPGLQKLGPTGPGRFRPVIFG